MLCFERVDYAAQRDAHALVCHAVILSIHSRKQLSVVSETGTEKEQ
jgi:ABC-type multidrug transport system fused ATPase/permease subunit